MGQRLLGPELEIVIDEQKCHWEMNPSSRVGRHLNSWRWPVAETFGDYISKFSQFGDYISKFGQISK